MSTNLLISLTLANVPLAITSSLPLLVPYTLKSYYYTPLSDNHLPAGEFFGMLPAGDIWSVVIESPNKHNKWQSLIFLIGFGYIYKPSKYGGWET